VAIHNGVTLTENGEFGSVADLVATLPNRPPTLFVKCFAADFLGALDKTFAAKYPDWQWRVTERERAIVQGKTKVASRVTTTVHFFGFKKGNYHKILDPVAMYSRPIDDVWPSDEGEIIRLRDWCVALRDFCDENNLEVRPTTGGISAQFLTDARFYPDARRKVPRATNDNVREHLPGNHYHLTVRPGPDWEYTAYYLDQRRAHHKHAAVTAMPDANGLYAMGHYYDQREIAFDAPWPSFHGLYCLDIEVPQNRTNKFMPAWLRNPLEKAVLEKRFVYSNELSLLRDMGYKVVGVRAAWGSHNQDKGLSRYSAWAQTQLDRYNDAPWIKPLLLATYGTLATRPAIAQSVFRNAKKGEMITMPTGRNTLTGKLITSRLKIEPGIANVLHRGMIEAATRVESLYYAIYLEHKGYQVLSVYADAIIVGVDDDQTPPPVIEPWRLKATLNHLQFINTQAFQSGEMTRMPGISGTARDSLRHRQRSPGRAPRIIEKIEAGTGRIIRIDTRTGVET
jgi:hypothetical protein